MPVHRNYSWAEDIQIVKKSANAFSLAGTEGEPEYTMSKQQLNKLLTKVLAYEPEEIAFMYLDFKEKPESTVAYFGAVNGKFLYTK